MNYFQGLAIPEHEESSDSSKCCSTADLIDCDKTDCAICLFDYRSEKEFNNWIAAGRPAKENEQ